MIQVLLVCTGNICRSPLAAQVLSTRLAGLDVSVLSAGSRTRPGLPMTPEAVDLAAERGVTREISEMHRSRGLTVDAINKAHLKLALSREHRTAIVELDPASARNVFTVREFARLAASLSDEAIVRAASSVPQKDPSMQHVQLQSILALISAQRGHTSPLDDPRDDDVIDPYRRSVETYRRSADQLDPGLLAVERVLRLIAIP